MTKTELKHSAQDELMRKMQQGIQYPFGEITEEEKEEMIRQFRRVEKLFGYEPNSWSI